MNDQSDAKHEKPQGKPRCSCPFCDAPVEMVYPFCKDCGKELNYCTGCGRPLPPTQKVCPECKQADR